jgi:hypothetical protein
VRHAALWRTTPARVVHENAAHHLRGDAEEMRPVLPGYSVLVNQPQIRFVDNRGGRQRVISALAAEVRARQPAQLSVDKRHELVKGLSAAGIRAEK